MIVADARKSTEQDFLVNDLAGKSQTGVRIALGSSTVAMNFLAIAYFVLLVLGLIDVATLLLMSLRVRISCSIACGPRWSSALPP